MSRDNWNARYPAYSERPGPDAWPPWYRISPEDLADFLAASSIPLNDIHSVLDIGSGDGKRIIHAIACCPELNRSDLHVTCVDFSTRAVVWGVDLWTQLRQGRFVKDYQLPKDVQPKWSMSFRDEDVMALPHDILRMQVDVIVDWMMLHGLPEHHVPAYAAIIKRMSPRYFLLKSFSKEGSTLETLEPAVDDVDKRQWSQDELESLFGDVFELVGRPNECKEELDRDDGDGPRAAKREYCFRRK